MLKNTDLISRRSDIPKAELSPDELVLLSAEMGNYYQLDGTALRIWEMLARPMTLDEICQGLETEYEISRQDCFEDIRTFCEQLLDHALITTDDPHIR
jgi:Coenzyme PQQ synthesis protein D (PqqD)